MNQISIERYGKRMEVMKFEELQLSNFILRAVEEMGFEEMSPIQGKAIPAILEGKDIIGQAQTGTGKNKQHLEYRFCKQLIQRIKHYRRLFYVQQESWRYRWRKKSEN